MIEIVKVREILFDVLYLIKQFQIHTAIKLLEMKIEACDKEIAEFEKTAKGKA